MKKTWLVGTGLLLILIAMFLQGFDSPATGIALVAGIILLFIGCFSWVCKLPWYVALTIGGMMLAAACFAEMYVPLIISQKYVGDERPAFLIHLIYYTLGLPGIVLISMTPILINKKK